MELNEKLAKWAGFKLHYNDWDEERQFPYFIPSGKPWRTHKIDSRPVPNFPEDLNACFKWLVPKLKDKVDWIQFELDAGWICWLDLGEEGQYSNQQDGVETPALALCKAIEQLIDKAE